MNRCVFTGRYPEELTVCAHTELPRWCHSSPAEPKPSRSWYPSSGTRVNAKGMLWQRSQAIVCLFCFKLDFLWSSKGEKIFRITASKCKTFWSPQRSTWLQSSLLTLCGPEIAPVFVDLFLTYHPPYITAPSRNYLARPFTVCCHLFPLSENIVLLPLDWCLSTPCLPFLSYLAWLHFLPCRKMFAGMKKLFLPIIFCTFRLLVLLDRKRLFCYLPHLHGSGRKKEASFTLG